MRESFVEGAESETERKRKAGESRDYHRGRKGNEKEQEEKG